MSSPSGRVLVAIFSEFDENWFPFSFLGRDITRAPCGWNLERTHFLLLPRKAPCDLITWWRQRRYVRSSFVDAYMTRRIYDCEFNRACVSLLACNMQSLSKMYHCNVSRAQKIEGFFVTPALFALHVYIP